MTIMHEFFKELFVAVTIGAFYSAIRFLWVKRQKILEIRKKIATPVLLVLLGIVLVKNPHLALWGGSHANPMFFLDLLCCIIGMSLYTERNIPFLNLMIWNFIITDILYRWIPCLLSFIPMFFIPFAFFLLWYCFLKDDKNVA